MVFKCKQKKPTIKMIKIKKKYLNDTWHSSSESTIIFLFAKINEKYLE